MEAAPPPPSSRGGSSRHGSLHASHQPDQEDASSDWTAGKSPDFNYLKLADLMAKYPGLAIFRRFATLNAKSLLYLQAEIAELEDQLELREREDMNAEKVDRRRFQWQARLLMEAPEGENGQWKTVLEIREKLKEYSEFQSTCYLSTFPFSSLVLYV